MSVGRSRGASTSHADPEDHQNTRVIAPYDLEAWERHGSSSRYVRHLRTLFSSSVLASVLGPALFSVGVVSVLALYDALRLASWPTLTSTVGGLGPLSLTSSALSLLLVFRTNSSYQRFVDARVLWGQLVNRSRHLVRVAMAYIPGQAARKAAIQRWVVAFAHCVRLHQRAPPQATPEALARVLTPDELTMLAASGHRPNLCLHVLSAIVAASIPDRSDALRVDEDLRSLGDTLGGTERIYKTPIPVSYTRHTSRILLMWLVFMPIALYTEIKLYALLVSPVLVLVLFGIDAIGVELEEPFALLPLSTMCDCIEEQTGEMLALDGSIKSKVDAIQ